ncbi:B-cell receptor CD22-like isoform X2 [Dermochelys coriacea]|nr:B-cell receptor CD22-like isoform X2 [Dermochelys coriacea]
MRRLVWLLFLPGFLCQCAQQPVEVPKSLIAWTGACLSIPCRYKSCLLNPTRTNKVTISSLTWYLNPVYDPEKKDFYGTVLYKHNASISPAFAGRVRFLGDLERDCSLQLSDLRASENGTYGLRLIVLKPGKKQGEEKWITNIGVNVIGKRESPGLPCRNRLKTHSPPTTTRPHSPPRAGDRTQESWLPAPTHTRPCSGSRRYWGRSSMRLG